MAWRVARIHWHRFKYRQAFNPEAFEKEKEKKQRKRRARLPSTGAALGFKLFSAQ